MNVLILFVSFFFVYSLGYDTKTGSEKAGDGGYEAKKLLVLGGAGDMGQFALQKSSEFLKSGIYSHITIGDVNEEKGEELLSLYQNEFGAKVTFEKINCFEHEKLVYAMERHDIIISAVGPFYIFGPLVARAAIDAKRPLFDINDDSIPTEEVLLLDEEAKEKGVGLFIGYGYTPGISNVLAKYGHSLLDSDSPVQIDISWAGGSADSSGFAVILHVFEAIVGRIKVFENYEIREVLAASGHTKVQFPSPISDVTVTYCAHPEPLTIPKFLGENVERVTLKGGLTPDWNNYLVEALGAIGLIGGSTRNHYVASIIHSFQWLFEIGGIKASAVRVDLYGKKDGMDAHILLSTESKPMGILTGYPVAIAAMNYAIGKIDNSQSGVLPPESQDAHLLLKEFRTHGIEMVYDESGVPELMRVPVEMVVTPMFNMKNLFVCLLLVPPALIICSACLGCTIGIVVFFYISNKFMEGGPRSIRRKKIE